MKPVLSVLLAGPLVLMSLDHNSLSAKRDFLEDVTVSSADFCKSLKRFSKDALSSVTLGHRVTYKDLGEAFVNSWVSTKDRFVKAGPPYFAERLDERDLYFSSEKALAFSLGLPSDVIVIYDADELKYIPQAMRGSNFLLLTDDISSLTPKKLDRVVKVSRARDIKLSFVWLGASHEMGLEQGVRLARTAHLTYGRFFDINQLEDGCS